MWRSLHGRFLHAPSPATVDTRYPLLYQRVSNVALTAFDVFPLEFSTLSGLDTTQRWHDAYMFTGMGRRAKQRRTKISVTCTHPFSSGSEPFLSCILFHPFRADLASNAPT